MRLLVFIISSLLVTASVAEPSKPQTLKQENSKCVVKSSGGEYPMFKIYRDKKVIYAPKSDGIVNSKFSPDGKYIALDSGEIDSIEGYGVMVVNCETGNRKGFLKGKATHIKKWDTDSLVLESDEIKFEDKMLP